MARYVAKNVVAAALRTAARCSGVCHRCCRTRVDSRGLLRNRRGGRREDQRAGEGALQADAKGIIETLDLRRPIYKKTAAFGHFGRTEPEFTWERTDKATALRADAGL